MQIQFETITPEIASKWLGECNPNNRRLNGSHVAFIAKTMESGEFADDNGDTIRLDESGNVLDGQHRLAAIVKTGQPRNMLVARGINRDTFPTIDIGRRRNVADVVGIDLVSLGLNAPKGITSAASLMIGYESKFEIGYVTGKQARRNAAPISAIREACARPGFVDAAERATKIARRITTTTIAPMTVALIACERNDKSAADTYFHRLQTMEGLGAGAPEHTVDRALRQWKTSGTPVQRSAYAHLYALLRGYVASRDGEPLSIIRLPKTPAGFVYIPTK